MKTKLYLSITAWLYWFLPAVTKAAGFVPCGGPGEPECEACYFIKMANNVITWLIGILFIVFAIILVVSGFKMVVSGGNPEAKTDAKKHITNAFIGLVVVLSAWLLVDTLMRTLLAGGNGEISGYGPWSKIACGTSITPQARSDDKAPLCSDCVNIPTSIYTKGEALICSLKSSPDGRCKLNSGMVNQIKDFQVKLQDKGISLGGGDYRVTEAWPPTGYTEDDPTGIHKSACHGDGTCFDFGKAGGSAAEDLAKVLEAADEVGLSGFYEVNNQSQKDALLSELGEDDENYQYVKDRIKVTGTPPHFHLIMGAGYSGGDTAEDVSDGGDDDGLSAQKVEQMKNRMSDAFPTLSSGGVLEDYGYDNRSLQSSINSFYDYATEQIENGRGSDISLDQFLSDKDDFDEEKEKELRLAYAVYRYQMEFESSGGGDNLSEIDTAIRADIGNNDANLAKTIFCIAYIESEVPLCP